MVRLFLLSVVAVVILGANAQFEDNNATTTVAPPYRNIWTVTNGNITCILFDANVTVAVKYPIRDEAKNTTTMSNYVNVMVPVSARPTDDSSCDYDDHIQFNGTSQLLRVKFTPGAALDKQWTLSFYFTNDKKANSGKAFGLYRIELDTFYDDQTLFNNSAKESDSFSSAKTTSSFSGVVGANADHSSKCSTADLQIAENAKVHLDTFQVQAFGTKATFLEPELCEHDVRTSDIVPIVVGACLAGLVIIVLIAYLVGRARAKRQGYASV